MEAVAPKYDERINYWYTGDLKLNRTIKPINKSVLDA